MKITRITIRNYRGISARDAEIPPAGALIRGGNTKGKTSTINAIRAALAGRDIGADAIRNGADKAEILVDVDRLRAHRTITPGSSTIVVTDLSTGAKVKKAAAFLAELLGSAPIDPLDLFLAKPPERRRQILAALPVTVTREQMLGWAPSLPAGFSCEGHGLEVVARAHGHFYELRATANKDAKLVRIEAVRLAEEAAKAEHAAPIGARELAAATADLETARAHAAALAERERQAVAAEERSTTTRKRIAEHLSDAKERRGFAALDPVAECNAAEEEAFGQVQVVEQLRDELRLAQTKLEEAVAKQREIDTKAAQLHAGRRQAAAHLADALESERVAAQLEASIASAAAPHVSDAERAASDMAIAEGESAIVAAQQAEGARRAREAAAISRATAERLEADAEGLDAIVQALANRAPAELLDDAKAIPGLSIAGEEVLLDGVGLNHVSGAEQMKLAVAIARRANAKSKILIVDGLERLDPDQLEAFVAQATADDWQLICTRVDRGDVVIEALSALG